MRGASFVPPAGSHTPTNATRPTDQKDDPMKHLRSLFDWTADDLAGVLDLAVDLKTQTLAGKRADLLPRRVLLQVFEKPSLRTRASFEAAMTQLGGGGIFFTAADIGLDGRESLEDVARVAGGYADIITLRTFAQHTVDVFAEMSGVPVVNGLTDEYHPCQAITDLLTIREHFGADVPGRVVYVGDGNNVAKSLVLGCGMAGIPVAVTSPEGFEMPADFVAKARTACPGLDLVETADPHAAVADAAVVYTDVWASMGQEDEKASRAKVFAPYQVNEALMASAPGDAVLLHCLPARRDLEVTDAMMESPRCLAFPQAENRMHAAKAVFARLLGVA